MEISSISWFYFRGIDQLIIYQPIFGELLVVTEIKKVIHKRYFSQKRAASLGKKGLVLLSRLPSEDIEYFAGGREIFIRIFQRNAMMRGLTLLHYSLS